VFFNRIRHYEAGDYPNSKTVNFPMSCMHCEDAACVTVCPTGASYKRKEDGIVLVDQDRCQGYRYCIAGCPYKKVFFNPKTGKSEKCIMCFPRLEKGIPSACAVQCVGRARWMGFLDDKEGQIHKLVKVHKVAIPLRPDRGTKPNVFYIPPVGGPPKFNANGEPIEGSSRVPKEKLEKLFGKSVHSVVEKIQGEISKKQQGEDSEI
jgi:complex iron-sulfur molybdoenzyme family reductase subunit beta